MSSNINLPDNNNFTDSQKSTTACSGELHDIKELELLADYFEQPLSNFTESPESIKRARRILYLMAFQVKLGPDPRHDPIPVPLASLLSQNHPICTGLDTTPSPFRHLHYALATDCLPASALTS